MSKPSTPKRVAYAGAGFLCRFTRIYDECLRQLEQNKPTNGHRTGQAVNKQNRGRE